ncbi:zinc-binding dehydrogenase [Aquicella lusitana]|uniref:S-(Hydroxymethyl)glutathione dehydrogenase/alcohol dehydrogenase n=1 Tax=Aquicella lusitana TaxID=254246 RepID=A0A370GXZ8_9COXI|nr:zinc-binding dehydrogenase [Aquicella lusitana]RDI48156.1 S-(hydroxymethyl)glutathione dehydrogenase/alcohol dehydrogenase [Aquicella lusitana]VVC72828.1 S-(hydroxymethyl)mycothiol dehydrogenase [Aquicella lusitana]
MQSLPKKMKAAILTELKKPLTVAEIELPETLAVGQVLVKIHFSGICGSQLGEIDGAKGEDKYLPHLLGHEASGTVLAVGPGVRHVKPGNKVVLHWRKGVGIDAETPTYYWDGRKVNAGWVTTLSEYAIVSENRVTAIPDESDLEVAALFGCAVTTGFGIIENNAKVRIGESVVVFGAGGIGLNIIQAAALVSAYPIIAVDLYESKLKLAKEMGATHVINSRDKDPRTEILSILSARKLDVFIDNTGLPNVIELGYSLTHAQGKVILVGVPRNGSNINIYSLPLHFGKQITGSHGGEAIPQHDISRYHHLYQAGRIKLRELITDYFSLDDINDAIQNMRNGEVHGRCLVKM